MLEQLDPRTKLLTALCYAALVFGTRKLRWFVPELGVLIAFVVLIGKGRAYARWLSKQTGAVYRLPRSAEWEYAASAPRSRHDDNCPAQGAALRDVAEGRANEWGLKNYIGNAREWVTSPLGPEVRGGSYRGDLSSCALEFRERHGGEGDEETGFRLLREL